MFFEGKDRIYFGGSAVLLPNERELATDWASQKIVNNPANAWVLGRFVEADKANNNKQFFKLGDLQMAEPTISYAPLNVNHNQRNVVGAFVATQMQYPETAGENPYIEALAAFWKYYFPDEYGMVARAAQDTGLFFSMECLPQTISTLGGTNDETRYPYMGRTSESYPAEINERSCDGIVMHEPHFVGGALVIPPAKPGWSKADSKIVAQYMQDEWERAEALYDGVAETFPDLEAKQWEALMGELLIAEYESSAQFSDAKRKSLAKSGKALPDGSFPIENVGNLKDAIRAIGRAKDPAKAKAHIKARAKALGASNLIPADW